MKADIYQRVTDRIVADLEKGVQPWLKPWNAEHAAGRITRPLRANGIPYRGINVLVLWSEAAARGFAAPVWMTFKQALELGAHVRKGETGTPVVYAGSLASSETSAEGGEEVERSIRFMKGYTVFNAEQVNDLPERFHAQPEARLDPVQRIAEADAFAASTRADIRQGGTHACYDLAADAIRMPPFECFRDAESYYATLAHELTHWTGHPSRLDRDLGRKRRGDSGYALEELVAELGAAFLCADLDLSAQPREDHASYIASWLTALKEDRRAIFSAAAHAQRAADFLHSLQPEATREAA